MTLAPESGHGPDVYLGDYGGQQLGDPRFSEVTAASLDRHMMAACDEVLHSAGERGISITNLSGDEPWVETLISLYEKTHDVQFSRPDFIVKMRKMLTP